MRNIKFIGKATGLLLGGALGMGIFGAILGAFLGHILFDIREEATVEDDMYLINEQAYPDNINVLQSILKLCVRIINLKDNIVISEVDIIKEFFVEQFKFDINEVLLVDSIITNIIKNSVRIDTEECITGIKYYCSKEEIFNIVQLLFLVATTDSELTEAELRFINEVAKGLRLNSADFARIKGHYSDELSDFYKTLELSKDATIQEIKSSYRKLVNLHHPDKNRENYDKKKFQEIVKAYKEIKKVKKFS